MTIPAGTYTAKAVRSVDGALAQYGRTKTNTDQIVLDLKLIVEDSDGMPLEDSVDGVVVSTFLYFSEKAAPYSIERLRALGWTGDDLSDLTGIESNEVQVAIAYEDYQGEQKMKVNIVTGAGRVTLKEQMSDRDRRGFAERFRPVAKAMRGAPAKGDDFPASYGGGGKRPSGGAPNF